MINAVLTLWVIGIKSKSQLLRTNKREYIENKYMTSWWINFKNKEEKNKQLQELSSLLYVFATYKSLALNSTLNNSDLTIVLLQVFNGVFCLYSIQHSAIDSCTLYLGPPFWNIWPVPVFFKFGLNIFFMWNAKYVHQGIMMQSENYNISRFYSVKFVCTCS